MLFLHTEHVIRLQAEKMQRKASGIDEDEEDKEEEEEIEIEIMPEEEEEEE